MRKMRCLSLTSAVVTLVCLAATLPVNAAQRRYSKFGVPEIYLRSPDELGLSVPGDVANSFQNLLVRSAGPAVYERFRLAAEALFSVTLRLQSLLEDIGNGQRGNFMVSPIAVTAALGQVALGTRGETHRQLGELLSLPGQPGRSDRKRSVMQLHLQLGGLLEILRGGANARDFDLLAASALFTSPNVKLFTKFRRETVQIYGTQIIQVDFRNDPDNALRRMNNWAAQHSRGYIQSVMPTPPPTDTTGILLNSVFLRAAWRMPFDRSMTTLGTFRPTLNSQRTVPFMRGHFNLLTAESAKLRLRILSLPYKRSDVGFYLILPYDVPNEEYDIHNLTSKLTAPDVIEVLTRLRVEPVHLEMPRLILEQSFSLKEPLARYQRQFRQRYTRQKRQTFTKTDSNGCTCTCPQAANTPVGIGNRFGFEGAQSQLTPINDSPSGDLYFNMSNASNDPRFQIFDLVHPMYLEVAEDLGPSSTPSVSRADPTRPGERKIRIDRPFTFFIRHESTLATVFWGTIVDPLAGRSSAG